MIIHVKSDNTTHYALPVFSFTGGVSYNAVVTAGSVKESVMRDDWRARADFQWRWPCVTTTCLTVLRGCLRRILFEA